jgi:hypothetical protein
MLQVPGTPSSKLELSPLYLVLARRNAVKARPSCSTSCSTISSHSCSGGTVARHGNRCPGFTGCRPGIVAWPGSHGRRRLLRCDALADKGFRSVRAAVDRAGQRRRAPVDAEYAVGQCHAAGLFGRAAGPRQAPRRQAERQRRERLAGAVLGLRPPAPLPAVWVHLLPRVLAVYGTGPHARTKPHQPPALSETGLH